METAQSPVSVRWMDRLADDAALDALVEVVDGVSKLVPTSWRPLLSGQWLGHPLHPALTDLPIGFWTSAWAVDIVGGRKAARTARRLVGLGVLSAVPAVASGLCEFSTLEDPATRRLAAVHAGSNAVATAGFAASWWTRRRHRLVGIAWTWAASAVATGAAMIGGHLAFGSGGGRDSDDGGDDGGGKEDVDGREVGLTESRDG